MAYLHHIFDHTTDAVTPRAGNLLVAQPLLEDDYFERSVVALISTDADDGAVGITLGYKSGSTIGDVLPDTAVGRDLPVYIGGPLMDDHLFYVHTVGKDFDPQSKYIGNGLWLGTTPSVAIKAVGLGILPAGDFRFIVGYSGWSKGQLEQEIDDDTWAVATSNLDGHRLLELDGSSLWKYAVTSFGDRYRHWLLYPRLPISN